MSRTLKHRRQQDTPTTSPVEARRPLHALPLHPDLLHDGSVHVSGNDGTPYNRQGATPMQSALLNIKQRLDQRMADSPVDVAARTSPGLARLRMTPGRGLKEKQKILEQKHQASRDKVDHLGVGGGVSMWPEMTNMRLSAQEVYTLTTASLALLILTVVVFIIIHGDLVDDLWLFIGKLREFPRNNQLVLNSDNSTFVASVLFWHSGLSELITSVHDRFDVSISKTHTTYQLCVLFYISGIATLLYYLIDSMLANSKLTPKRIKTWVCLLVVLAAWTSLITYLLVAAKILEDESERIVHNYNGYMYSLIYLDLDLTKYNHVHQYWVSKLLPPTSRGTLTIMGLVPLRDVMHYMQYYSLPIVTALLSPVLKLLLSLRDVYTIKSL